MGIYYDSYLQSLKDSALNKFSDIDFWGCRSLIDVFLLDRSEYKWLAVKGKIPKELLSFFSKRAADIERALKIPLPVNRKAKYEEIFDEYFAFQRIKESLLLKVPSSDQTRELTDLVCPIHKTVLKKLGVKRCLNAEKKKVVLPMYLCDQCDKLYTYTADYVKGKIIRVSGMQFKNIYGDPSVKITTLTKGTKCIVYSVQKPVTCKRKKCNKKKLVSSNLFRANEKDELKNLGGRKCPLCGTYYVSYPVYLENKDMLQCMYANNETEAKKEYEKLQKKRLQKEEQKKLAQEKRKKEEQESELFDHDNAIRIEDFVVWGDVFHCRREGHIIKDIDAKISLIAANGEIFEKTIAAGYCRNCDIFFIMRSSFQSLKKFGTPICRVCDEKAYYEGEGGNWGGLNPESKLKQYGYSVSQTDDLTTTRRRKILTLLIDKEIMTRADIISYLDLFIRMNSTQENKAIAVSKWEDDREFIENYNIGFYTKYGVGGLHRR